MPLSSYSEDIAPFRMTDVSGDITLRATIDEDKNKIKGIEDNFTRSQSIFEEELRLNTRSYIYHPNLIGLDIGGALLFPQGHTDYDGNSMDLDGLRVGFNTRMSILDKKPYPLALYYDRSSNTVTWTFADRFYITDERYGFDFSLKKPVTPFPMTISGYRLTRQGEGVTLVSDEKNDHVSFRANELIPYPGNTSLSYSFDRLEAENGNPAFPIVVTTSDTHSVELNSVQFVGSKNRLQIKNFFSYLTQSGAIDREEMRANPGIRWSPSDSISLFSNYGYLKGTVNETETTNHSADAGLNHRLYQSLFTDIDVRFSESGADGAEDTTFGGGGRVTYRKKIPTGHFSVNYGPSYDVSDRSSSAQGVAVIGERKVLGGLSPVGLDKDFVIESSVAVFNLSRSQQYMRGLDYEITIIGSKTRIQRLVGGSIVDGETVLVDYLYATTGTYEFSRFSQIYGASATFLYYLTLSASFRDHSYELLSGVPTQPLNSSFGRLYNASMSIPVGLFVFGGDAQYEEQDEEISPFDRQGYSASVQFIPGLTSVMLSGRREITDYLKSTEGVDLWGASARLNSTPIRDLRLTAETGYEEDTGQSLAIKTLFGNLFAEWRIRQLTIRGSEKISRQEQGDIERNAFSTLIELRREF